MATPCRYLFVLFLCLLAVLAVASPYPSCPCECPQENETRLQLYLHQFPFWENVPNPNERPMVNSSVGWGQMYVDNWFLTTGPDPFEKAVAHAEGFHIHLTSRWYTSHIILFEDGSFAGSTLVVLGLTVIPNPSGGEWSITGGTGVFANAHGTIKYKDVQSTVTSITDVVRELNIHVFYTPETKSQVKLTALI